MKALELLLRSCDWQYSGNHVFGTYLLPKVQDCLQAEDESSLTWTSMGAVFQLIGTVTSKVHSFQLILDK